MAKKKSGSFDYRKKQYDPKNRNYCNNPYNFIQPSNTVFRRYNSTTELPKHNVYTDGLLTGTITCTLTAETPLCISNGLRGNMNDFVQNANGTYIIPGSSIRGLMRTNMTILGMGAIRPNQDFDDVMPSYRVIGSAKSSLKKTLQEDYNSILRVGKGQQSPVFSAYLVREQGKYFIYPTSMPYIRLEKWIVRKEKRREYRKAIQEAKRNNSKTPPYKLAEIKYAKDNGRYKYLEKNPVCKNFIDDTAKDIEVWYRVKDGDVSQIISREQSESEKDDMKKGILVCPGKMKGQNSLYLFPEFDSSQPRIEWDENYRIAYEMDYKLRENTLGGTDTNDPDKKKERRQHWKLPTDDDKPWPIFCYDNRVIGKNPYLRLTYRNTVGAGLPSAHQAAGESLTLDYPFAIFGFAAQETGELDKNGKPIKVSYRSRVSFGDFTLQSDVHTLKAQAVMGAPKITSFPDYVLPERNGGVKNYNADGFQLRGIKQYWLHKTQEFLADEAGNAAATQFTFLTQKPQFRGEIRFQNLSRDELGLLLWCLKLDDGCYQTLGKGKPLGYGKMSVSIDSVKTFCPERMYHPTAFADSSAWTEPQNVEELIQEYQSFISRALSNGISDTAIRKQTSIEDFMFMHRVLRDSKDIRYMAFTEYKNRSSPLPTIAQQREELEKK